MKIDISSNAIRYNTYGTYNELSKLINEYVNKENTNFSLCLEKNNESLVIKYGDFNTCKISDDIKKYKIILNDLKNLGMITNTNMNESFRFKSSDHAKILTTTGANLEYYIYSTALVVAGFNNAEMSVKYSFNNFDEDGNNEIDVICTDDTKSMFISCKDVSEKKAKNNMNYYLYEILLEAKQYGISPAVCIAMPQISMFTTNENNTETFSNEFKKAKSRGVYLIGKECFENPNILGKTMRNIMDGNEKWYSFLK